MASGVRGPVTGAERIRERILGSREQKVTAGATRPSLDGELPAERAHPSLFGMACASRSLQLTESAEGMMDKLFTVGTLLAL